MSASTISWEKTACNLCYVNCGLEVLVENDRIAKVRGDRDNPKSKGYLCNKAARIPFYAHHRDRCRDLTGSMVAVSRISPPTPGAIEGGEEAGAFRAGSNSGGHGSAPRG